MSTTVRRLVAFVGAIVFAVTIGTGFDAAGTTPNYDGDMATRGMVAGAALGAVVAAGIRD